MSSALHVWEARIGLLVSAFAVASALAAIPVTAVSSSYPLTFAVRLLAGIMGGTLWSMLAGYAAPVVPAANRGRAIAIVLAGAATMFRSSVVLPYSQAEWNPTGPPALMAANASAAS